MKISCSSFNEKHSAFPPNLGNLMEQIGKLKERLLGWLGWSTCFICSLLWSDLPLLCLFQHPSCRDNSFKLLLFEFSWYWLSTLRSLSFNIYLTFILYFCQKGIPLLFSFIWLYFSIKWKGTQSQACNKDLQHPNYRDNRGQQLLTAALWIQLTFNSLSFHTAVHCI